MTYKYGIVGGNLSYWIFVESLGLQFSFELFASFLTVLIQYKRQYCQLLEKRDAILVSKRTNKTFLTHLFWRYSLIRREMKKTCGRLSRPRAIKSLETVNQNGLLYSK